MLETVTQIREVKMCSQCDTPKPISEFYKRNGKPRSACKICEGPKLTQYMLDHPEKMKGYRDRWKIDNPDKVKLTAEATAVKGIAKRAKKTAERLAARPANYGTVKVCTACETKVEKPLDAFNKHPMGQFGVRAVCRECEQKARRDRDKTKVNENGRAWAARNPGKVLAWRRANMRKRSLAAAQGAFTLEQWQELLNNTGRCCLDCGISEQKSIYRFSKDGPVRGRLTPDHVVAVGVGGTEDISNIQPLCLPCNMKKSTKTIDFRLQKAEAA